MSKIARYLIGKSIPFLKKRGIGLIFDRNELYCDTTGKTLLNLGSGNWECKGWTNLDYSSEWYFKSQKNHTFIEYDIRHDDIPYEDNSVDCIYTSHVIEHIEDEYVSKMFSECYRVLKKEGVLRISCPDADFLWLMTKQGKSWWEWRKPWCKLNGIDYDGLHEVDLLVGEVATPRMKNYGFLYGEDAEYLDYVARFHSMSRDEFLDWITCGLVFNTDHVGNHINYWTFDKIRGELEKSGFDKIIKSRYGGSLSSLMKSKVYFDVTQPGMSLYVDAVK